jgi:hypothetical protein
MRVRKVITTSCTLRKRRSALKPISQTQNCHIHVLFCQMGGASTGETTLAAAAAGSRQFAVFAPENNGITAAICCYIATPVAETRRLRWMRERSLFYTTFTARSARGPARGISWAGDTDLYNQKESSRC